MGETINRSAHDGLWEGRKTKKTPVMVEFQECPSKKKKGKRALVRNMGNENLWRELQLGKTGTADEKKVNSRNQHGKVKKIRNRNWGESRTRTQP